MGDIRACEDRDRWWCLTHFIVINRYVTIHYKKGTLVDFEVPP
jgi:hypothetical protein